MGKKKNKMPGNAVSDNSADDASMPSEHSGFASPDDPDEEVGTSPEEVFGDLVDEKLSSKRSATRLQALSSVKKCLMQRPDLADVLAKYALTLIMNVGKCVKQGKPEELPIGLQVAAVAALVFSEESDECVRDAAVLAISVMKDSASTPVDIMHGIRTLSICNIADPYLDLDDGPIHQILYDLWTTTKKPEVLAEALCHWTLHYTTDSSLGPFWNVGQKVLNMIESDNYDVSCAALETIGFMYELSYELNNRPPAGLGKKDAEMKLASMVAETDRSVTKQMRKDKKDLARKVQYTVDSNEGPQERFTIGRKTLEFDGWKRCLQLEAIRSLVGAGLPMFLAGCPRVRSFLDITHVPLTATSAKITKAERKAAAQESTERDKIKTMKDHKKSANALANRYEEQD